MNFTSDNTSAVPQAVLDALAAANDAPAAPYGADPLSLAVADRLRTLFEAPEAAVYLVGTGTAANALILATLGQPWEAVFCAHAAHVEDDECGAPEFYTGGAKLTLVEAPHGKMTPGALHAAIAATGARGVHGVQRGPVSITQPTEMGTTHTLDELRALTDVARGFGCKVHLDGARFANAVVRLGCAPAEMTWKAGVDAVAFGGTKNGLMGVEAAIFFDPAAAWEFELRRKRGAHLFSKHRYLAAQMAAYLDGDLWRDLATRANAAADRLAAGLAAVPGAEIAAPVGANTVFVRLPRAVHRRLQDAGAHYYLWGDTLAGDDPSAPLLGRLVCAWNTDLAEVDAFVAAAHRAAAIAAPAAP